MKGKSGIGKQLLSLPKGGGAIHGIGENFQVDIHKGTLNLSVPIQLPPGRNKLTPNLTLSYSSGQGNGPFGMGWSLPFSAIKRRTSKGVPRYNDYYPNKKERDVFVYANVGNLVLIDEQDKMGEQNNETHQIYCAKMRGSFDRITHIIGIGYDYWEVRLINGMKHFYGSTNDSCLFDKQRPDHIFSWMLNRIEDPFENKILFVYKRDNGTRVTSKYLEQNHQYNQLYLEQVKYVNYAVNEKKTNTKATEKYLYTIHFDYGEYPDDETDLVKMPAPIDSKSWSYRPDPFSTYRAGFEIRTVRRCRRLLIVLNEKNKPAELIKAYHFNYHDNHDALSMLKSVGVTGYQKGKKQIFPAVTFKYSQFNPHKQRFEAPKFLHKTSPATPLSDPNVTLVDLFGNGHPCILQAKAHRYTYWRNLGNLKFDVPRVMKTNPTVNLAEKGVVFADMYGNGSADLVISKGSVSGFYETNFDGTWRAWHSYQQAPSFNLEAPNVRLVDMTGDGIIDVCVTTTNEFLIYLNRGVQGWSKPLVISKIHDLDLFPDVSFGDPDNRVRLADMTGDGMQDIVVLNRGKIDYWPNLGYGRFAKRISIPIKPALEYKYDLNRVFLSDINGNGCADLIYINKSSVSLWLNIQGHYFSQRQVIDGTPQAITNSVNVADLKGLGVSGLLWSFPKPLNGDNYKFLDFTGGEKPYLLNEINNNLGALTKVTYKPSTWFYAQDYQTSFKWKTHLPFPVQCVASITKYDYFSQNKLTTNYRYHHGYWDGVEREYVGFGRVDQYDTEVLNQYNVMDLDPTVKFTGVNQEIFSTPIETRTWFHLGPVSMYSRIGSTIKYFDEYWLSDQVELNALVKKQNTAVFNQLLPQEQRKAMCALRGTILRSELYARDNNSLQSLPYTITESNVEINIIVNKNEYQYSAHSKAQRTTQWERGNDPMVNCVFYESYDKYDQVTSVLNINLPRRKVKSETRHKAESETNRYWIAKTTTEYAQKDDEILYLINRVAKTTTYELHNNDQQLSLIKLLNKIRDNALKTIIKGQTLNYYDGKAYKGLALGKLDRFGALTRSEQLVLTSSILEKAYSSESLPYWSYQEIDVPWSSVYPKTYQDVTKRAGYIQHKIDSTIGYYSVTVQNQYDFQKNKPFQIRGMLCSSRDPLNHKTIIDYDIYHFLPTKITTANNLCVMGVRDYRTTQTYTLIDQNGNQTHIRYTPLGMIDKIVIQGKENEGLGDTFKEPTIQYKYNLLAYIKEKQPIWTHTRQRTEHVSATKNKGEAQFIEKREYTDGFGRLLQTRLQAKTVLFSKKHNHIKGKRNSQSFIVSGWKYYNNKGKIVQKFEPFFSRKWSYELSTQEQRDKLVSVQIFYDGVDRVFRTVNPNNSEQYIVYGKPNTLKDPKQFLSTPWERYIYNENHNAGRTHPNSSSKYKHYYNLPQSITVDSKGRKIQTIARYLKQSDSGRWEENLEKNIQELRTLYKYDLQNLVEVIDPRGQSLVHYVYDLIGNIIRLDNIDSGLKITMFNAMGQLIEQRDNKGALSLLTYDTMNRIKKLWARNTAQQSLTLREKYYYGEDTDYNLKPIEPKAANLLGKLYFMYDEAGIVKFLRYNFKGKNTVKKRWFITNNEILATKSQYYVVDWNKGPAFSNHSYETSFKYDALDRATAIKLPEDVKGHRKSITIDFTKSSKLKKIMVDKEEFIKEIGYNAKGQHVMVIYGNNLMTRYNYDPKTFLLTRLRTRPCKISKNSINTYELDTNSLQDTRYKHDLIGNILTMKECSPGSGIPKTRLGVNALKRKFIYDPLNQLVQASGRESKSLKIVNPKKPSKLSICLRKIFCCSNCLRTNTTQVNKQPTNVNSVPTSQLLPPWNNSLKGEDINKTQSYIRQYRYDEIGNLIKLKHISEKGTSLSRRYSFFGKTNRLQKLVETKGKSIKPTEYIYKHDATGNLLKEGTKRHFSWDYSNRLIKFRNNKSDGLLNNLVYYLYDSAGQRVKKIRVNKNKQVETTVYIDGLFEHQWTATKNNIKIAQSNTYHVLDGNKRIAIIRTRADTPNEEVQYQLNDHLGSSVVVTDKEGKLLSREEYFPFGETSFGGFKEKRYRYAGKETDSESNLQYYGARYYAPWLGKWLTCDPMGLKSGINLYQFNKNNPIMFFDPDGRDALYYCQSVLDFIRGFGDAMTFGLTAIAREAIWGERGAVIVKGAYIAGEITEFVVEIGVTGGLAIGKKAGQKFLRETSKNRLKYLRERGVELARKKLEKKGKPSTVEEIGQGHHRWPVKEGKFARPQRAKDPRNIIFKHGDATVKGTQHYNAHRRLKLLEDLDDARDITLGTRQGINAMREHMSEGKEPQEKPQISKSSFNLGEIAENQLTEQLPQSFSK